MKHLFTKYPIADITIPIIRLYAQVDAFSQAKLKDIPSDYRLEIWAKMISGLQLRLCI